MHASRTMRNSLSSNVKIMNMTHSIGKITDPTTILLPKNLRKHFASEGDAVRL